MWGRRALEGLVPTCTHFQAIPVCTTLTSYTIGSSILETFLGSKLASCSLVTSTCKHICLNPFLQLNHVFLYYYFLIVVKYIFKVCHLTMFKRTIRWQQLYRHWCTSITTIFKTFSLSQLFIIFFHLLSS